VLDIASMNLN